MVMRYWPAFGAVDVPHPRTPGDILLRSCANQAFAGVAYGHLVWLLGSRRPQGVGTLPVLLLSAISVVLPELILVQLGFALLPALALSGYRSRVAQRFRALPKELNLNLAGVGMHAAFAVFNALPLAAVLGAYRQRLNMQWHGRTYVANLGLDHRNGWAAAGGLVACVLSLCVLGGLSIVVLSGSSTESTLPTSSSQVNGGTHDNDRGKPEAYGGGEINDVLTILNWVAADWGVTFEVVGAALTHQILLGITQHPVPLLLVFDVWYIWPIAALLGWLMYKRRRIDKVGLVFGLLVAFVAVTVASQVIHDFQELWLVSHEILWYWNWRWKVKDQVSAKFDRDV